jgi:hypothetical protein
MLSKLNIEEIVGEAEKMTVVNLGLSANFTQTKTTWQSLSSGATSADILTEIPFSRRIDSISKNFIDWSSSCRPSIAGHLSASRPSRSFRMVDVTVYVNSMVESGADRATFLFNSQFRHAAYTNVTRPFPADDLSHGALMKISANSSPNSNPQLIHFTD